MLKYETITNPLRVYILILYSQARLSPSMEKQITHYIQIYKMTRKSQ